MKKSLVALALLLAAAGLARADTITSSLGNSATTLVDGQTTTIFDLIAAQGGQPAPFNGGIGADPLSNFSASWTHLFGAITDTIIGATIEIGIVDHDSASPGDQLASFGIDGVDLTGALNALFESGGGANTEYNVYQLALGGAAIAALADGAAAFSLALTGPVETPSIFGGTVSEPFNGANLIYSTLTIETEDAPPVPVPEPPAFLLLISGLLALHSRRRHSELALR